MPAPRIPNRRLPTCTICHAAKSQTGASGALDRAADAAYSKKGFASDAERVAFLFELYHQYTSLLPAPGKPKKRKKNK